jgi:tripartite motif-containing protein 71
MIQENIKFIRNRKRLLLSSIPIFLWIAMIFIPQVAYSQQYSFITKWGSRGTADGQFRTPSGIAIDSSGNVYVADVLNHRIQKFSSDGRFITKWGSRGTADGQFLGPNGIATDASGNVYVVDSTGNRIQKFSSDGRFITKWVSQGPQSQPMGIAIDSSSNVYVAASPSRCCEAWADIQVFNNNGTFLTTWNTSDIPRGIVTDPSGKIYVSLDNDNITAYSNNGTFLTTWGSTCYINTGYGCDHTHGGSQSGQIGDGQFNGPTGVALDTTGKVYVVDTLNNRIQVFNNNGTFLTKWGTGGNGDGQFHNPQWIAINNRSGQIYVSDSENDRIQSFAKNQAIHR